MTSKKFIWIFIFLSLLPALLLSIYFLNFYTPTIQPSISDHDFFSKRALIARPALEEAIQKMVGKDYFNNNFIFVEYNNDNYIYKFLPFSDTKDYYIYIDIPLLMLPDDPGYIPGTLLEQDEVLRQTPLDIPRLTKDIEYELTDPHSPDTDESHYMIPYCANENPQNIKLDRCNFNISYSRSLLEADKLINKENLSNAKITSHFVKTKNTYKWRIYIDYINGNYTSYIKFYIDATTGEKSNETRGSSPTNLDVQSVM